MMDQHIAFAFLAFTSYITLINPLSIMPVFMTMTAELSPHERRITAQKATITAFFTMLAFAFSGQLLFNFFGISVDSFRIVGGVIFFVMGYDMLQARLVSFKVSKEEVKEYVTDISITPLAIPMICGPGAITNSIILMEDANDNFKIAALILAIFSICLLTFLALWGASRIIKLLGDTGNKIMMRLMGLIVMVIAVEFFLSGLRPIIRGMMQG